MKYKLFLIAMSLTFTAAYAFHLNRLNSQPVPYPEGYRNWIHVKSGLTGSASPMFNKLGGFHHIYANPEAITGYKTGKFPEGSMIVFDKIEMIDDGKGNISEGKRKWLDVMIKRERSDSTGGWDFDEFLGDSKTEHPAAVVITGCYRCHAADKTRRIVFSQLRN
jgi:hypothetical protein